MSSNGQKIPIVFQLDDKTLIDGAVVKPISFAGFAECIAEAQNLTDPKTFEGRVRRTRLAKQVVYYANGTVAPISIFDIPKLSIPSARLLMGQLDTMETVAGKIIGTGDGVDKSIVYELGMPIPVQGKEPIKELEFFARNYGDVEDIMAANDGFQQTTLLLTHLAKPLGSTLMTLPSWAVDQISLADGVEIMRKVLPPFLGLPPEL